MRFMMLMIPKGYEKATPGTMPDAQAVEAMMKYNKSLQEAGVLLALDGLRPPSIGVRITFENGKPLVTNGPFIQTKETLGGYWMIQVASKEEAIQWAMRCPASRNEIIEIRQVQELSDFPADIQKAADEFSEMGGLSSLTYVDGFVAAVPTKNKDVYKAHAEKAAVVFKEYGALKLVECWGDDVPEGKLTSFPMAVQCKPDETVVFSWILWPSREARNQGMANVMSDPRLQPEQNSMPFDGKRMIYGGFEMLVAK